VTFVQLIALASYECCAVEVDVTVSAYTSDLQFSSQYPAMGVALYRWGVILVPFTVASVFICGIFAQKYS